MAPLTGPNADVLNRLPRYAQRRTLRGARIVDSFAPHDDAAGAVVVQQDGGQRYRVTVSPEWWRKHGRPAPGSLLICYEHNGKLSVESRAEFEATTALIPEQRVGPWQGR